MNEKKAYREKGERCVENGEKKEGFLKIRRKGKTQIKPEFLSIKYFCR